MLGPPLLAFRFDLGICMVRPWEPADAPALVSHGNDREVWRNLRDRFPHPYTAADAREFIEFARTSRPRTHFAIEVEGEAVGGIGYDLLDDVYRRSADIGYWLGRAAWGRGIATAALRAITEHAWLAHPELVRLQAGVFAWNTASVRVLEKAGYVREGVLRSSIFKDGQVVDSVLYASLRPSLQPSHPGPKSSGGI